ncbi:hypothetical protein [Sphaerimonospora thailandensis]|uniref:Uncharacterized protein n=1 Tax=Sphaerimonospora thailandensis TaxID=795644 RepID=A0A8J3RB16_9ACTN|nr:hypothetical protein [Sphaerimonospora thailandensis]GIH71016.1 hypothetical protein Mth01_32690 [Sphaerimonospora thailandensis]
MTLLQRCENGQVLKLMSASGSIPIRQSAAADHVSLYIDILRTAGVRLPEDMRIAKAPRRLAVQHQWTSGIAVTDLTDPALLMSAMQQIAAWVRALEPTPARLDTNLANFILVTDGLVCIDVLPPLLTDLRPPEHDDWQALFGALCYDTDITLCALAGYTARLLLATHGTGAAPYAPELTGLCPGHDRPGRLPVHWFHSRQEIAVAALRGQIPKQDALTAFTVTSVLQLRHTAPECRRARIDYALSEMCRLTTEGIRP